MTDTPTLKLYDSLARKKRDFTPMNPKRVTMYNCGPTVYSYAHIGNARAAVVADVLFRVLQYIYPEREDWKEGEEPRVVYARNITDVDDKIIAAAKEQGVPISDITEKYARIYNENLAALNCLPPTHQPKATENIGGMIDIIQTLLKDGYAYASEGHVFFDVSKYDEYGRLSGNTLDALRGGDRVGEGEVARKKNAADFVLWKPELDGVGWDAPFGHNGENMRGRPGWHIECSAMARDTLGETIDIHCGGVDLKFPHHENEIAQSNCAHGKPMANYWVHNEFLNMGSTKMSKSLGNVTLIDDLLKDWDGEVIRLALLKAHYRSELSWSEELLKESKAQLDGWYRWLMRDFDQTLKADDKFLSHLLEDLNTVLFVKEVSALGNTPMQIFETDKEEIEKRRRKQGEFVSTLSNSSLGKFANDLAESFNTAAPAISLFQERMAAIAYSAANLLGLLQKDPEEWFKGGATDDETSAFDTIAIKRAEARKAKDWAAADAARDEASAAGIVLEDQPDGTTIWRKA